MADTNIYENQLTIVASTDLTSTGYVRVVDASGNSRRVTIANLATYLAENGAIATLVGDLDNLSTSVKTSIVNAINAVNTQVATNTSDITDLKSDLGDLADLDTTDKSSIVGAINEVAGGGSGLSELQKTLIITLFQNAIYTSDQTSNISALYNSFIDHTVEVTGISLNESAITITEAYTLVATLSPSGATGLVEWSSSNTSVATVSQTGLVTPVSDGTTTITASCESYSATCAVTVDTASSVDITQNGTTLVILATPDVSQSGTTLVFS